jgi:hypothetical protein
MLHSLATRISIEHQSLLLAPSKLWPTLVPKLVLHLANMAKSVGTLDPPLNIVDATNATSRTICPNVTFSLWTSSRKISFPTFTPEDYLKQTAEDMLHLLKAPAPSSNPAPTIAFGPPILNACAKIASMLRRATPPAPSPPAPAPRVPELSTLPVAPPRVPKITLPVAPPRVPEITLSVAPPRVPPALLAKKIPPAKL